MFENLYSDKYRFKCLYRVIKIEVTPNMPSVQNTMGKTIIGEE